MTLPKKLTISKLQEMYRTKAITPEAVIDTIIKRVEQDEDYHIWITPPSLEWIQPYLDRVSTLDQEQFPLWGIPFAIKDNIDVNGLPTTAGCPDYAYVPSEHATVVKRMIDAGAIPIGKTNLDQFATGLVGTRSPYGETRNALNKELISGGSSSGSAVAVARGQAAFAFGTDTAGSGRVPASLNNLIGFKPSLGAWPTKGVVPACESLDCVNVFTQTFSDAMLIDSFVRGLDASDPWSKELKSPALEIPRCVYLPATPLTFYGPYENEYRAAWEKSVLQLQALGIKVNYMDLELLQEAAAILYDGPWVAERWAALGEFVEGNPGSTFPVTEQILRSGASAKFQAADVFQASHRLQQIKLEIKKKLGDAVLILPTVGGTWKREQVRRNPIETNSQMGLYTNHCNLLDLCAISVPVDEAGNELPFGVTIFADSMKESFICGIAHLLEKKKKEKILIAVCGLHMRGYPLEKQMKERFARFVRVDRTAPLYQMVKLPSTPPKPGLIKKETNGSAISVEIWEMPRDQIGDFADQIPSPLGLGKVELEDGSEVLGFICEGYAVANAEDITSFGSWHRAVQKV